MKYIKGALTIKATQKEFPQDVGVLITGLTLKGDKGERGEVGKDGPAGRDGKDGKDGPKGEKGLTGRDGLDGAPGLAGQDGQAGAEGTAGSPDTPEEVVNKVNQADNKIKAKQIEGLIDAMQAVDNYGKHPSGASGGGTLPLAIQDEGIKVNEFITTLNFIGAGVTAAYLGNGVVSISIPGGAGNFADNETPTGTVDGANATFTLAHTPSPAGSLSLYLNGFLQQAGGGDYTLTGASVVFNTAPLSGSILIAYYRY